MLSGVEYILFTGSTFPSGIFTVDNVQFGMQETNLFFLTSLNVCAYLG